MRRLLMSFGLTVALFSPALAQTSVQSSIPPTNGKLTKPAGKLICQREERTGSRLDSSKVCMTAAEWEEVWRMTRESLKSAQRNSHQMPCRC